ncbi:MAG: tRNA preQ1(34) S-adenosylmethionine ribosyltransferase-isomerase QueA [Treponema sp.]|jgi:S-adenosylmethionine:tRNA ribosyltransferase-isomerase|nr:tRNA preQ1(34) S-adenosylmethionine ribosyltransferase-isomerase QueA [Treponema sp.]
MKTDDFFFDLPGHLVAQYPPPVRGESRLMVLDRAGRSLRHAMVKDLPDILGAIPGPRPFLVFNDSKVRKARLLGISEKTGSPAEFLLAEKLDGHTWKAMAKRAKRHRTGARYLFGGENRAEITAESGGEFRVLRFEKPVDDAWLDRWGHVPLPPYIRRNDTPLDGERYQTVYARFPGSAAAPTAGLHFTAGLLARLAETGVDSAFVTLHVGLGTFLPVRTAAVEDHVMHGENFVIDGENARKIESARSLGRRIIAVGTTSVRTLESAWDGKGVREGEGTSSLFLYPGSRFNVTGGIFTNFHTPRSTLLMLAAAFAGLDFILESYAEAVREGYRFFSYGDAMLIL